MIVATPGMEESAATRRGRIGFDTAIGYLEGGMEAVRDRPDFVRRIDRITAPAFRDLLESAPLPVVDVRFEREWRQEAIPGSINIPLNQLRQRIAEIPTDRPVVVYCQSGQRSSTAASLLVQAGYTHILDLIGGIGAWKVSSAQGVTQHV